MRPATCGRRARTLAAVLALTSSWGASGAPPPFSAWTPGSPVPLELLHGNLDEEFSEALTALQEIENQPLLLALVVDPGTLPSVRLAAAERALTTAGPTAFFEALRTAAAAAPPRVRKELAGLLLRSTRSHVLVDVVSLRQRQFSPAEAEAVRATLARELARGRPWDTVVAEIAERFSGGVGSCRCVGAGGAFAIERGKHDAAPLRPASIPAAHARRLLEAPEQALLLLAGREDREAGDADRWWIYRVRERYAGGRSDSAGPASW